MKGSPVHVKLDQIIDEWKKLCEMQLDAHVAISGDEGAGKSQLIYGVVVNKLHGNSWGNMIYTENPKEFDEKYEQLEHGMPMGFDESLNILGRLDWSKIQTKNLVIKFRADVRKEKNAIWLYGIQIFRDLHQFWRTHRIRHWIELAPRQWFNEGTMAFYLERQRVPFLTGKRDTWLLDEEERRWMEKMKYGAIVGESYLQMLRTHPFYRGEFRLLKLSDADEKEYAKRRAEAREIYKADASLVEKPSARADRANSKLSATIKLLISMGVTQEEIGNLIGTPRPDVSRHLQQYKPPVPKVDILKDKGI